MPRILLFGTGAVGTVYAYILHKGGADVTLVCRSNYDAITQNGISMESAVFGQVSAKLPTVKTCAEATGPWDYIVVCTKVTTGLPKLITPAVSAETTIVLIQNGIDTEPPYQEAFPDSQIITSAVYLLTTQVRPGHVVVLNKDIMSIGTYPVGAGPAAKESLETFADLIKSGGGTVKTLDDVQEARWQKLIGNAAWSPLCALTLLDDKNLFSSSDDALDVLWKCAGEIVAIAHARGYEKLSVETFRAQFEQAMKDVKVGKEPSMLGDVRAGKSATRSRTDSNQYA